MLPFLLKPYLKKVIWGGSSLAAFKGLGSKLDSVGESWEVSAMPGRESVVDSGEFAGISLADLSRSHGPELLGKATYERTGGEFPLLIKFIDSEDDLSVQVHPGDEIARRRHGCLGKCEMWYIIAARDGSRLGAGLSRPLDPDSFESSVADGSFIGAIDWYDTHPGDTFYLPAGSVHAIGRGNLLLEIQQPSDITYRIYDYDRRDAAGNLRLLAVGDARDAIDYTTGRDYRVHPDGEYLLRGEHFTVRRLRVTPGAPGVIVCDTVTAVTVVEGSLTALCGTQSLEVGRGHTLLVPADARTRLEGDATVIVVNP